MFQGLSTEVLRTTEFSSVGVLLLAVVSSKKRFQLGDESPSVQKKTETLHYPKRKDPNWKNDSGTIATIKIVEEIRELEEQKRVLPWKT